MPMVRPTALVVGAASRDLTIGDPRGWRLGGPATYASLMLGRLGVEVWALIGVDRDASTAIELAMLRSAGVLVTAVELETGPVFENIEAPGGRRQRCLSASTPIETPGR